MELLEGMDLGELVTQKGPLPQNAVVQIARQTAKSLIALESKGLVHRDLKPSNLFLTVEGNIKLLDLGLARNLTEADSSLTGDDWVLGTFDYMAPEQAMDVKVADHRSDLYSLGCTLFMLLTGRPPYPKPEFATPLKKALAHSNIPFPVPCLEKVGVSSRLSLLLAYMCEKSPAKRPQSAKEIESVLNENQSSGNLATLVALDGKIEWIDPGAGSVKEGAKLTARFLALASMLSILWMIVPFMAWLAQPLHSSGQEDSVKIPSMVGENPNLVSNPSFTKGLHFYQYQLANTGYYGEFIPDNGKGMDDRYSIRFEPKGSHAQGAIALIGDNVPLEIGKNYTFSVWFDASQMTKGNLSADLADTHDIRLNAVNGRPGWQKMEAEFKALRPTVRIRLIRDGEIKKNEFGWIDLISLSLWSSN
jgi:serine/threonine protein kinase